MADMAMGKPNSFKQASILTWATAIVHCPRELISSESTGKFKTLSSYKWAGRAVSMQSRFIKFRQHF